MNVQRATDLDQWAQLVSSQRLTLQNAKARRGERPRDRVELLSDGRQFVAAGIHPATQRPYEWRKPLIPYGDLTAHDPAVLA